MRKVMLAAILIAADAHAQVPANMSFTGASNMLSQTNMFSYWQFHRVLDIAHRQFQSGPTNATEKLRDVIPSLGLIKVSPRTVVGSSVSDQQPNSRAITAILVQTNDAGLPCYRTNRYIELATGMHYLEDGVWKDSRESIVPSSGGAVANNGRLKVSFSDNLNVAGSVQLQIGNDQLQCSILGITYHDASTGTNVWIAVTKDTIGTIISSNQVMYADAFQGITADVLYTYKRGSFSQDVILHSLPDVQSFGLNPAATRIEVITELLNNPSVQTKPHSNGAMATEDEEITFPGLKMRHSRAFQISLGKPHTLPMQKKLMQIGDRRVIIEHMPVSQVAMPVSQQSLYFHATNRTELIAAGSQLPPKLNGNRDRTTMMAFANATQNADGFVLDYYLELSDFYDDTYVFQCDTTYYISGSVGVNNAILEGGTVIKAAPGVDLEASTVTCQTSEYMPAIFTASDDDSVGAKTVYSTGSPVGVYADQALAVDAHGNYLHDLKFSFADTAIYLIDASDYSPGSDVIENVQVTQCSTGVRSEGSSYWEFDDDHGDWILSWVPRIVRVRNALFSRIGVAFSGYCFDARAEHLTLDNCTSLGSGEYPDPTLLRFTNSVFANLSSLGSAADLSGDYNGFYSSSQFGTHKFTSPVSPFQAAGSGLHYLADNSAFDGKGTANISSDTLSNLKTRSTHSPIALPVWFWITDKLTLMPQVPRYSGGPPSLGFYYSAIDYTTATTVLDGGTVTVLPGTAIAVRCDNGPTGLTSVGFWVYQGGQFISHGLADKPIVYTSDRLVQEAWQPLAWYNCFVADNDDDLMSDIRPLLDFRFCNFYFLPDDHHFWSGYNFTLDWWMSWCSSFDLFVSNSSFYGAQILFGPPYNDEMHYGEIFDGGSAMLKNNLFYRVDINSTPTYYYYDPSIINVDFALWMTNNLLRYGRIKLVANPCTSGNWTLQNNLFDKVAFVQYPAAPLDHDYNAYWQRLPAELQAGQIARFGANDADGGVDMLHDVALSSAPPYQSGALGPYYLPTSSPLYNAGSTAAADSGLFHYTTRIDQIKEGAESSGHKVNIGLHYVATSGVNSTEPKQSDSDGIPDYIEDQNGNGIVDPGETDWNVTETVSGTIDSQSPVYDDMDLSGDGLVGRIKRALGIDALDPANPLALTQILTGAEPDIMTFKLNLPYSSVTNVGDGTLLVDSGDFPQNYQQLVRFKCVTNDPTDGMTLALFDNLFEIPGPHVLQLEFCLSSADILSEVGPIMRAQGPIVTFEGNHAMMFDPFYMPFDGNGATLYALTFPNTEYNIELCDSAGNHLASKSGTVPDGTFQINETWDLVEDDVAHTVFAGDLIVAKYTIAPPSAPTEHHSTGLTKADVELGDGDFSVAYAWNYTSLCGKWEPLDMAIQYGVVDPLLLRIPTADYGWLNAYPYYSTFNLSSVDDLMGYGDPGYLQVQSDATDLLASLSTGVGDDGKHAKNFYTFMHGSPSSIFDGRGVVEIKRRDVDRALHNEDVFFDPGAPPSIPPRPIFLAPKHPFRFVFLDACSTGVNYDWAHTFGIDNYTPSQWNTLQNLHPEQLAAFVGWREDTKSYNEPSSFESYGYTLEIFNLLWQGDSYNLDSLLNTCTHPDTLLYLVNLYDLPVPIVNGQKVIIPMGVRLRPLHHGVWDYGQITRIVGFPYLSRTGYR